MFGKKKMLVVFAAFAAALVAIAVVLLTLPKAPASPTSSSPPSSGVDSFAPMIGDRVTFTATVLQLLEKEVLVEPVEGSAELRSASRIYVSLSVRDNEPVPSMRVGDTIEIDYDGLIQETYPATIPDVYAIRLKQTVTADSEPLLKITVAKNKRGKPTRVSTWRTAMETDYIVYFVDVDSVKVKIDAGYREILDAIHGELLDIDTLRSELMAIAQESGSQAQVIFGDGLLDSTAYTQTTMRFEDFTVTFTGHQSRREVFFSPPNSGGFTQNVQERIAEESAKFPLTVKKSASVTVTKVTRPEWNLAYDVCYYNIDSASVMIDGKAIDLLDAVSQGRLTFDQLITDADSLGDWIYSAEYKDGGSKLYCFDEYAILKMNKINGDKTLYIGTVGLTPDDIR